MSEIYFDNAATTKVCKEAADIAYSVMTDSYGNPSSTHKKGRDAALILKDSRNRIAKSLGCKPSEVYFTSCGSESDNWAVICGARLRHHEGKHIISSEVEHDAVRKSLDYLETMGYEVTRLKPESDGSINTSDVIDVIRDDTILISLMMVNNETGSVTDIAEISKRTHRLNPRILVHTDAVQAFMKIPFSLKKMDVDLLSISGHKIHAPKGVGALFIRNGIHLPSYIIGGGQENGIRAGTEALPQIAAFGVAAEIAYDNQKQFIKNMCDCKYELISGITRDIPEARIIQSDAPHILNISLPGYRSEVIMNYLESRNIYVSKSSACKKGARSHVLESIGLEPDVIDGAIRISLSRETTTLECQTLINALHDATDNLAHK